jgi:hypothetical protein
MADLGTPDDRTDSEVMYSDLIPAADQDPTILQKYPDFAQEYGQYREANAGSVGSDFWKALKGGSLGTAATYTGAAAIAGVPGAAEESQKLDTEAAAPENTPTINSLSDIAPGDSTLGKVFSKDALRYVAAKAGGALPSLAEMAGISLTGAAVGSAIEPGAGTVAGAGEGVIEEILGRGIIKSAIKNVVKNKVLEDASETAVADAIRAGDKTAIDAVTQEAKRLAAGRAEAATNLANVYGMSAGGIYNETGSRKAALGLGAAAALTAAPPFISLPARVLKGIFPKLSGEAAQAAAQDLIGSKSAELLAKLGRAGEATAVGTGGVLGMEAASIVAKNITDGKDPLSLDDADWKRLREAAVGGALASAPFGALAMRSPVRQVDPAALGTPPAAETEAVPAETPAAPAPEAPVPAPSSALDLTRRVSAYSPDEARARLRQLTADPQRDETEEKEYQLLRANAPSSDIPEAVPPSESEAAPEELGQPAAPPVGEAAPTPEPETAGVTFKDAGFESPEALDVEYAKSHLAEHGETQDEFIRRIFCQGQAA